jgi:hypothetical protein
MAKLTKQERDWEAEDDFRTVTRAKEIMNDKKRMSKAKKAGKRVLKEKQNEVKTIASIVKPRKVKIRKPDGSTVTIKRGSKKPIRVKNKIKVY